MFLKSFEGLFKPLLAFCLGNKNTRMKFIIYNFAEIFRVNIKVR